MISKCKRQKILQTHSRQPTENTTPKTEQGEGEGYTVRGGPLETMLHRKARTGFLFALLLAAIALNSCKSEPKPEPRRYELDGKIVAVKAAEKSLTISHKDIPGLMKGMTMDFTVKDDWVLKAAKPGDHIGAVLVMDPDGEYLENVSLTQQGSAPDASTSAVHMPETGEQVPDFAYVDQSGRKGSLAALRGRPVLLTFIYTRCPLPDYCIRMSGNFAELEKQLKQQSPEMYGKLVLLSVSIDPEYDKPAVLKQYGKNYVGQVDPGFEHWKFVSAPPVETRKFAEWFGLQYIKQENQIVHSLRTTLIGPDGKVVALYSGNEWKPADVIKDLNAIK